MPKGKGRGTEDILASKLTSFFVELILCSLEIILISDLNFHDDERSRSQFPINAKICPDIIYRSVVTGFHYGTQIIDPNTLYPRDGQRRRGISRRQYRRIMDRTIIAMMLVRGVQLSSRHHAICRKELSLKFKFVLPK